MVAMGVAYTVGPNGYLGFAGRVSGLMCSLNAVNGVPACADNWLLNEVARQDWGFDGYVDY